MDTKKCKICQERKPETEFYKNKLIKDGLSVYCKPCSKTYRQKYKEESRLRALLWKANNHEQWRKTAYKAAKVYYYKHPEINIIRELNRSLNKFLSNPTYIDSPNIGCSSIFLRQHIESQWAPDMNWDNYKTLWKISRIQTFDLSTKEGKIASNHYTNLKPEYKKKNSTD